MNLLSLLRTKIPKPDKITRIRVPASKTVSKVEAYPGSQSRHFAEGENLGSTEFNDAAQGLLQTESGQSIPAKHLGLKEAEGQRFTGPGYWQDDKGVFKNPTTEYGTVNADPELARLKAHYEQVVMAQDGVANTTLSKGGTGMGSDFMSVMMPGDTNPDMVRKALEGADFKFDDWSPEGFFMSPGEAGLHIGSPEGMGRQQRKMLETLGPEAKPYSRIGSDYGSDRGGSSAYQGGVDDGSFSSVKDEMQGLLTDFSGAGQVGPLNRMLKDTAGNAPAAYEKMQGISGSAPRVDFDIIWKEINSSDKPPVEVIQKLIKDNVISQQDAGWFMQQLSQPQRGLLA